MSIEAQIYELHGPRDLRVRKETLETTPPGANDVLARTLVSAISPGTETAAYVGLPPLRPMQVYPRVTGYCNIAEVEAVGEAVVDLRPGDRIATFQSHRSAFVCPRDEVMAVLPPATNIEACSLSYLFHLGYAAALRARLRAGDRVAVIGMGAVGLGAVAVAAMAGAEVHAVSDLDWAPAEAMGARTRVARWQAAESAAREADIVITTSNRWKDWELAMTLARVEGTVAMLGFPGRGEAPPDFNPLDSRWVYDKQLALLGCGTNPSDTAIARSYSFILARVADGTLPARRLIGEIVPAAELGSVYERLAAREQGLVTCVLDWR